MKKKITALIFLLFSNKSIVRRTYLSRLWLELPNGLRAPANSWESSRSCCLCRTLLAKQFLWLASHWVSHSFVGCSWSWLGHLLFKVFTSPVPLSSCRSAASLIAPRLLDSLQAWGRGGGTLFPEIDLALGISCGHFSRTNPLLRLEAQTRTAVGPFKPETRARKGAPRRPPAIPSLPRLRSRRGEPGCWIQSLRRVLHFHKRAAAPRG